MDRLNSEEIKEICKIQHKKFVTDIIISKMPIAYTNDNVWELERDLKIRSINDECIKKIDEIIKKYGREIIKNTFEDKDLLQKKENRFTFDDQRKATKEVIGKELTLEEVIEMYSK